jgi:hypothetical protein
VRVLGWSRLGPRGLPTALKSVPSIRHHHRARTPHTTGSSGLILIVSPTPPSISSCPFSPTFMSPTTEPLTKFQSILNAAFDNYAKQTGLDLTRHPSAAKLQDCHSPEDVVRLLLERETEFNDYRDKYRKLIDCFRPIVQVVHAFSGVLGEVVSVWLNPYYLIISLCHLVGAIQTNESHICRRRCSPLGAHTPLLRRVLP